MRNVKKTEFKKIDIPLIAQREDRGFDSCKEPLLKLADPGDSTTWKNDISLVFQKCDTLNVFTIKDGVKEPAIGNVIQFPNDDDAKGFVINWREYYDTNNDLKQGCYKVWVECIWEGFEFEFYHSVVNLRLYSTKNSEGTVRINSIFNDWSDKLKINFTGSGAQDTVRFRGFFGKRQPNYTTENITYTDRTRQKVYNDARPTYSLICNPSTYCVTYWVEQFHLLHANVMYMSDYNGYNHQEYKEFPVILSDEDGPEYDHFDGTGTDKAKIVATFKEKVSNTKSKYETDINGSDIPNIGLWNGVVCPIPTCDPVNINVNSTNLGTVASGDTLEVSTVDTDGNPIASNNTLTGNDLEIEAPDANYTVQYVNGTLIESGTIPSGGSVTVNVPNIPTCDDATWELRDSNNVLLDSGSIASGGSATIIAPDANISLNGVSFPSIPSGGSDNIQVRQENTATQIGFQQGQYWRIDDSPISVNGDAYTDLPATDSLNIPVEDENGNTLDTTIIGGVVEVFLYWYMSIVLAFRTRMIAESATFETPESLTTSLIELGETDYNDATLVLTPHAYSVGTLYSVKPNDGTADFSYTQNTANGTRINENGIIEILPANTPRITWENGEPLILVEESITNMNPTSLSFDWQPIRIAVDASNPNGGFGDLPYQELSRIDSGVVFRDINPTTTDNTSIRFYIRNIGMPFQIWLRSINTTSQVLIEIDSLYNVTEVSVNSGSYSVFNTNDNGWHEVILTLTSAVGDRVILYLDHLSIIGNSFDLCQLDLIQDINLTSPIITNGSTETRNDDIYSVTPPSGTSEIKEYLANGTINTITTIPATYTPAVGKYKKIVMS